MPPSEAKPPQPRVVFLPPLMPEKQAYALARYSRSGDPVEASLAWVETHSEERFWESFYFDYGHASIADLGHVATCFEDVSELAAQEILDETLWDGQARSTRYQDFATKRCVVPSELTGHPLQREVEEHVAASIASYQDAHARSLSWLRERHPRPDAMDAKAYERNLAARAFDMARSFLPLAIPTSVGQVVSIRTLEKQISRLLVSDLDEVRAFAQRLVEGCRTAPLAGGKPVAPTLARHARPFSWQREVRERARAHARALCGAPEAPRVPGTTLHEAPEPATDMLASLLYEASGHPWSRVVAEVTGLAPAERRRMTAAILEGRGPHDELPRACRTGLRFCFEIVMDVGGWRDMHRHRRCVQLVQPLDPAAGAEAPPDAAAAGIAEDALAAHRRAAALASRVAQAVSPAVAGYALPMMHLVRSVFRMDFAEADYVARLRSGVKGHPSYRRVAWDMHVALKAAAPELAMLLDATPPELQDPLTR